MNLDELAEQLHGELADVTNEIESLRKERQGINDRIRERLRDQKVVQKLILASIPPKERRRRG